MTQNIYFETIVNQMRRRIIFLNILINQTVQYFCGVGNAYIHKRTHKVCTDRKLSDVSGEEPIFEWSGWRFDPNCEIFSLLDG